MQRTHYAILVLLLLAPLRAWACSCDGTSTLRETVAIAPLLVEGRVTHVEMLSATLQVTKVLKGSLPPGTIALQDSLCFQTLHTGILQRDHTYVLPLYPDEARWSPEPHRVAYTMPGCSETGWELRDGKLYTFGGGGGPQLYGSYWAFRLSRPIGEVTDLYRYVLFISASLTGPMSLAFLGVCAALAVFFFTRLAPDLQRRSKALVLSLPLLWLAIGLWSAWWFQHGAIWTRVPPVIGLIALLSITVIFIRRAPALWRFALPYALLNGYLAATMCQFDEIAINAILY